MDTQGNSALRTGSIGNRSAEDLVKTLVEPKKNVISAVRNRLLSLGYSEEVEYDAVNIEPVLIYNKAEQVVLLKHKWDLVAMIPIKSEVAGPASFKEFETQDEDGNKWFRFNLPADQIRLFSAIK
ncbi:MAG: hypothetical protein M1587_05970 [Thaumarchaeota archaeon]|nr:hypothetical protein [Nitrososphaerota archaeon]